MRPPTPSRVLRALEAQEAELSNLPSLPDLDMEESTDDFAIDESSDSLSSPFRPGIVPNRELATNVTTRRPMPRLREDFLNSPVSLSSSPDSSGKVSSPPQPYPLRTPRPASALRTAYIPAATPADRHKSFLLSLAQSGARSRFANPTPHPDARRPRLSHPLAQVHSPDPPRGTGDMTFISTASSHDLAVNERANASFDPTTDAAAKFNQVKLNAYLRGLNKHLIEENEALAAELAELRGDGGQGASPRSASVASPINQGASKESERIRLAEEQADSARRAKLTAEQAQARAERELRDVNSDRDTQKAEITRLERRVETLEEDIESERKRGTTLIGEATSRIEEEQRRLRVALEAQLAESQSNLAEQNLRVAALEDDLNTAEGRVHVARQEANQMEVAIKEAEKKMVADAEELRIMGKKIDILVRERDEAESRAAQAKLLSNSPSRKVSNASTLASQSSATSTAHSSGNAESIPLDEHQGIVDDLEVQAALPQALRPFDDIGDNSTGTPTRMGPRKGTPHTVKRFALFEKTLGTPGPAHFADYTMFQNDITKNVSGDLSAYLTKFADLRAKLDIADDKYDHAIEELGTLGITNVRLVEMVHESRGRVGELENEVSELRRSEERVRKRLQRCKCTRCQRRFDASPILDAVGDTSLSFAESVDTSLEDPAHSREGLQAALENANNELSGLKKLWTAERQSLMGEKAMLRDTANKLTAEIKAESAKVEQERRRAKEATKRIQDEGERQRAVIEAELNHAKRSISTLEEDLRQERAKLRSLATERNKSTREMADVMLKLERTETDMAEVKGEIERLRKENKDLDEELRHNSQADQNARRLAAKISENQALVEQLRQERDALTKGHAELQTRYAKISEQTEAVRQQLAKHQSAHDKRRHQLDMHVAEIQDLRQTIQEQAAELQNTEEEQKRIAADRVQVAQTVAALEVDLHKVRREAEKIRRDVTQLREERAHLQARGKEDRAVVEQSQAQIQQLGQEIVLLQKKLRYHEEAASSHICAADEQALVQMQQLHREHCQSFMRRIRYLKVRVTRESAFRSDLAYQKRHLFGTISCFEMTEKNLVVTFARLGISQPPHLRRRKKTTFKSAVLVLIFLCRTRLASDKWRRARVDKDAVLAGYELARGHALRT